MNSDGIERLYMLARLEHSIKRCEEESAVAIPSAVNTFLFFIQHYCLRLF